jgi:hypothetical protein
MIKVYRTLWWWMAAWALCFAVVTLTPWYPSKTCDSLLPLGTAYVNPWFDWRSALRAHVAIATALCPFVVLLLQLVQYLQFVLAKTTVSPEHATIAKQPKSAD